MKKTFCKLCAADCRIEVETDGNNITKVVPDYDHPRTQGYICYKAQELNQVRTNQRITAPLKKVNGQFVEIPWEQAIDEIANKVENIARAPSDFNFFLMQTSANSLSNLYIQRWLESVGLKYYFNILGIEKVYTLAIAPTTMFGFPFRDNPDINNSDVTMVIGANPVVAHQHSAIRTSLNKIRKDATRTLIVVDPVKTETAEMADIFIQIKPGTDAWFLMLLLKKLVDFGVSDSTAFDIHQLPPISEQEFSDICGISIDQITDVAKLIKNKKFCIFAETGIDFTVAADITAMLMLAIHVLTGNFNNIGGNKVTFGPYSYNNTLLNRDTGNPAVISFDGGVPAQDISANISKFKGVFIHNSNPARSIPNSKKFIEEITKCELVVVMDHHYSSTTELADYILPIVDPYEIPAFSQQLLPIDTVEYTNSVCETTQKTVEQIIDSFIDKLGLADETILKCLRQAKTDEEFILEFSKIHHCSTVSQLYNRTPLSLYYLHHSLNTRYTRPEIITMWYLVWQHCLDQQKTIRYKGQANKLTNNYNLFSTRTDAVSAGKAVFDIIDCILKNGEYNFSNPEYTKYKFIDKKINFDMFLNMATVKLSSCTLKDKNYKYILCAGYRIKTSTNGIRNGNQALWVDVSEIDAASINLSTGDMVRVTTPAGHMDLPCKLSNRLQSGHIRMPNLNGINLLVPVTSTSKFQPQYKYVFANLEKIV